MSVRADRAAYTRQRRAILRALPPEKVPHGTAFGYTDYGCRCESCSAAQKAATKCNAQQPVRKHGTMHAYSRKGCRCVLCREAAARVRASQIEKRSQRPDIPHGLTGYKMCLCRCDICTQAHADVMQGFYQAKQAATRPVAMHHRQQWTGIELEVVERTDLTAKEAALMLGRTAGAVESARHRLRVEPKLQRVLGAQS